MGFFDFLSRKVTVTASKATATAYNRSVFAFLNNGQVILDPECYDFVKAFNTTGAVYECVTRVADKIKASPRVLYKVKDAEGLKRYKELAKSDNILDRALARKLKTTVLEEVKGPAKIQKLLKKPNDTQNWGVFVEMLTGCLMVRGNAYVYGNAGTELKDKKWSEMYAMPVEMKIISGGTTNPVLRYFLNCGWLTQEEYPQAQIKHLKMINLNFSQTGSHLYGMSPLTPYLYSIDTIKNANKEGDKQLKNGGKLGFISPKNKEDELGEDQLEGFVETISEAHGSTKLLKRLIPSSIPVDFTEIGLSSTDLQLLELKNASADDIYRGYKVPLFFRTTDSATYNNVSTAKKQFIYDAVAPIADMISDALTEFICEPYLKDGEEYIILIDYMSLPELAEDIKTASEWMEKAFFLTPNEKREVLGFGKSNQLGMDEIFISKNYVRLQDVMDGKILQTTAGDTNNQAQEDGSQV